MVKSILYPWVIVDRTHLSVFETFHISTCARGFPPCNLMTRISLMGVRIAYYSAGE